MPIYEFRCLNCNEINEFLFTSADETREMVCPHCGAEELERIMSTSNFSMGTSAARPQANASTRACASGSCSTLEIPGKYE